jgi:hypothetical protein
LEPYIIFGLLTFLAGGIAGFILGLKVGLRKERHTNPKPANPVPGFLFMIGGAIAMISSFSAIAYSIYFLSNSQMTKATVVEIREKKDDDGAISRYPVYEYFISDGQEFTDTASMSAGREFVVGDMIPIRYLATSPQNSRIDYFAYHWSLSIILGIGAMALTFVGLVLNWNYKRKSRMILANL